MPLRAWPAVARYQNDGRVLFELYNEPHNVSWSAWQSGGDTGDGWQAVGMQQLYDTVRATGANNLVVIDGLDWAYDLSGVPARRIEGSNILYATHAYVSSGSEMLPRFWDVYWGFLTATDPVLVTRIRRHRRCLLDGLRRRSHLVRRRARRRLDRLGMVPERVPLPLAR